MSIFDEFFIKFTSNAKEVQKDIDAAGKSGEKLEKKLNETGQQTSKTFQQSEKAAKEFDEQLRKTDKTSADLGLSFTKLATAGVGALAGFAALGKLKSAIVNTIDYNAALEKQSRLTNISARELDIWRGVVQQAGGDSGEFLSFISQLNQQYAELGIGDRVKRVTNDLINLSKQFQGLSNEQSLSLGSKLGLTPDVILTLQKGPQILQDMIDKQNQLSGITAAGSAVTREFKKEWQLTLDNLAGGFTELANIVLPLFTSILHFFNRPIPIPDWLKSILPNFLLTPYTNQDKRELGLGGGGATGGAPPSGNAPLGIRSNNPGNLQPGGREAVYPTLAAGISAEESQLQKYGSRGINTLAGIAATWPDKAHQASWLASVQRATGFGINQPLNMNDPATLAAIAQGINVAEGDAAANSAFAAHGAIAQANSVGTLTTYGGSSKSLSVGSVTVNTHATDSAGIANDFHSDLANLYAHTNDGELF